MEPKAQTMKSQNTNRLTYIRYLIDHQFSKHPSVLIFYIGLLSILLIFVIGIVLFLTGLAPAGEPAYTLSRSPVGGLPAHDPGGHAWGPGI
jgi:hypothetical protein